MVYRMKEREQKERETKNRQITNKEHGGGNHRLNL